MAEDLDWLLDQVRIPRDSQMRVVMVRRYVDGYSDASIALELGIKETSVRSYACRAWARVEQLADGLTRDEHCHRLIRLLEARDYEDAAGETVRQHAAGILQALRGKRRAHGGGDPDPTKAGPLVTLDDVVLVVERQAEYLEALAESLGTVVPVELEQVRPYRGETRGPNGRKLEGC